MAFISARNRCGEEHARLQSPKCGSCAGERTRSGISFSNCTASDASPTCRKLPKREVKRGWAFYVAVTATSFALLAGMFSSCAWAGDDEVDRSAVQQAQALSHAFRHASKHVLPSVVTIKKVAVAQRRREKSEDRRGPSPENPFEGTPFEDFFRDPGLRRFFEGGPNLTPPRERQESGIGSGVIIDSSGIILTNNHVVRGGGKVVVRLADGREFLAQEVKTDSRTDLAVVRIAGAGKLPAAKMGDSEKVEIGDWVIAVGNPFGLEETVTAGIISAKGRGLGIAPREEFLQTDAAINPGNSGGPLVNLEGEVIGINTAISTRSGGFQGVGFAIPVNLAKWVSRQLIEKGSVQRAYLGTGIQQITPELAERFNIPADGGVLIAEVREDSPAAEAGIQVGDIVLSLAGKKMTSPRMLQAAVEESPIGGKLPIEILRDGKKMTLHITMKQQPKDYGLIGPGEDESQEDGRPESAGIEKLGLDVTDLTEEQAKQLKLKDGKAGGVLITEVDAGSYAALAGLSPGMVIASVDRKPVKSVAEFQKEIEKASLKNGILLLVRGTGGSRFVMIKGDE